MRRCFRSLLFALLLPLCLLSQDRPADSSANLPIKRVVLYKNGVGYFEHLGRVRDNQEVIVSFTSGQLNDVLKSLTVLDLNGGRITGVAYGSSAPLERQLGDLRIPAGRQDNAGGIPRRAARSAPGGAQRVHRHCRQAAQRRTEDSHLWRHTTEISPAFSVRLLDRGLAGKVERLLDLAASAREPDTRKMVISTAGPASEICLSVTSAKRLCGKLLTVLFLTPRPAQVRCSKDGRSWITRWVRTGTM